MEKIFNSDHLQHLCRKYGLRPSKKYGQNFLINPEPIERMLEAADISSQDAVVEVGPGFGVLTLSLAERAKEVVSFEIEKKLQSYWEETKKTKQLRNVDIVWGNVLKSFLSSRPSQQASGGIPRLPLQLAARLAQGSFGMTESYKVVANLPYQITSPVIRLFLEAEHKPTTMVLMVQKEVAERICAKPGDMSLLSVSVQYYADPEVIMIVPRSNFWPEPAVDSAVIKLIIRDRPTVPSFAKEGRNNPLASAEERAGERSRNEIFFKLVKAGFANRRKLLIKNLEPLVGKKNRTFLNQAFQTIGLNSQVRAQELSVQNWQELSTYLTGKGMLY